MAASVERGTPSRVRRGDRAVVCSVQGLLDDEVHLNRKANQNLVCISSGSQCLDELLQGGLYVGEVTEVVGPSAVGKTQMAMAAATYAAAKAGVDVTYIDTSQSFSPLRIQELHQAMSEAGSEAEPAQQQTAATLSPIDATLSRIHCHKAFDMLGLSAVLECVRQKLIEQAERRTLNMRLLVVDCFSALAATLLGKRPQGHALMIEVSRQIKAIARAHHVAVLLTCHAVSQGRRTAGQKGLRAACGESWSYVADTRLFCSANPYYSSDADAADPRAFPSLAVLHKSCRSKLGSACVYQIGPAGIQGFRVNQA